MKLYIACDIHVILPIDVIKPSLAVTLIGLYPQFWLIRWYPCSINVKPDTHMISMRYKLQTVVLIGPINNVPSVLTNQHIFLIGLTYHWIPSYLWPLDVRSASSLCICHGLVVQWALKREMMKSSNAMGSLARITVYICSKRASGEWGLLNHSLVNIHGISSSKQHFRGAVFSNLKHDYLRYSSSILLFSPYDFLLWSTDLYTTLYIWRSAQCTWNITHKIRVQFWLSFHQHGSE